MYSFEITRYLEEKNYCLSDKEFYKISDPTKSNQIQGTFYDSIKRKFHLWTNDGCEWDISVYHQEEDKEDNTNE